MEKKNPPPEDFNHSGNYLRNIASISSDPPAENRSLIQFNPKSAEPSKSRQIPSEKMSSWFKPHFGERSPCLWIGIGLNPPPEKRMRMRIEIGVDRLKCNRDSAETWIDSQAKASTSRTWNRPWLGDFSKALNQPINSESMDSNRMSRH